MFKLINYGQSLPATSVHRVGIPNLYKINVQSHNTLKTLPFINQILNQILNILHILNTKTTSSLGKDAVANLAML